MKAKNVPSSSVSFLIRLSYDLREVWALEEKHGKSSFQALRARRVWNGKLVQLAARCDEKFGSTLRLHHLVVHMAHRPRTDWVLDR